MVRFLWVVFQIDSICAQNSDYDILRSLKDLPKGLPATFRRVIRRLQDSTVANASLARKILEIVAGARRPLNLDELGEAMSVTPGDTLWDNSKLVTDVLKCLECCGSLLVVDEEFSTVHFAHSSIKEHLITTPTTLDIVEYHIDLARANSELGRLCVTYLNLDVFSGRVAKQKGQLQPYAVNVPTTVIQSILPKHESIKKTALAMLKGRRMLKNDSALHFQQNLDIIHSEDRQMKDYFCFLSYCREHWLHHTKMIHLILDGEVYILWERLVIGSATVVELPWAPEEICTCGELLFSWLKANWHLALTRKTIEQVSGHGGSLRVHFFNAAATRRPIYHQFEKLLGLLPDKSELSTLNLAINDIMDELLENAIAYGCELFVELLVQRVASVNPHSDSLTLRLHDAISSDNRKIVALLVDHGADINYSDANHGTALIAAVHRSSDISILEFLLENGADTNARGGNHGTALIAAASKYNVTAIELLVDAGADINASHEKYGTALYNSISTLENNTLTVETLLRKGADVNARGGERGTALIAAASHASVRTLQLLVNAGADINFSHAKYGTALINSITPWNDNTKFEILLSKGADVNLPGGEYGTALIKAASFNNLRAVDQLLSAGADIEGNSYRYGTALLVVSKRVYPTGEIFDRLIGGGADVNHKTPGNNTPLLTAVENNNHYAVAGLLKAGADVSFTGETMASLLKMAAQRRSEGVVRALLADDLDAATKNLELQSELDFKKSIKKTMRVLETDEKIARLVCTYRAGW